MRIARALILLIILSLVSMLLMAQEEEGYLPLGLGYGMQKDEVRRHMAPFRQYLIETDAPTLGYVIPEPSTQKENGFFLTFSENHLVEVASVRSGMAEEELNRYSEAIQIDMDSKLFEHVLGEYGDPSRIYRDNLSYITLFSNYERGDFLLFMTEKEFYETVD